MFQGMSPIDNQYDYGGIVETGYTITNPNTAFTTVSGSPGVGGD